MLVAAALKDEWPLRILPIPATCTIDYLHDKHFRRLGFQNGRCGLRKSRFDRDTVSRVEIPHGHTLGMIARIFLGRSEPAPSAVASAQLVTPSFNNDATCKRGSASHLSRSKRRARCASFSQSHAFINSSDLKNSSSDCESLKTCPSWGSASCSFRRAGMNALPFRKPQKRTELHIPPEWSIEWYFLFRKEFQFGFILHSCAIRSCVIENRISGSG